MHSLLFRYKLINETEYKCTNKLQSVTLANAS